MFRKFCWMLLILASCTEQIPEEKPKEIDWSNEKSTQMNQDFAVEEELRIRMYLADRPSWKTRKTGSGLRYFIYKNGKGPLAQSGLTAEVKFQIELLDGTVCYQTDSLETEDFEIDKSEIESGIQEAIKKMHIGDRAKLILPSHLAHGLTGDMDQIPPLSTIVVDLELIALKKWKK